MLGRSAGHPRILIENRKTWMAGTSQAMTVGPAKRANALARAIRVPANRISAIVSADRAVTADTALRLAKALGTTPVFWLNLQKRYELDCARDEAKDLGRIEPVRVRASG
jgi:addiction module HigA family antidote